MAVYVWRFHDAPPAYQRESPFGGDEDYVILSEDCTLAELIAERLEVCDTHRTMFGSYYLFITCHA